MRIGIIDDERPARCELIFELESILDDVQFFEASSGSEALSLVEREKLDVCFLDINLGDISGTSLIGAMKAMQPKMKIVFVTAYSQYAVKAFELKVDDYVMKPFNKERISDVLARLMPEKTVSLNDDKIAISCSGRVIFQPIEDIVYVETYNRGCRVHCIEGSHYDSRSLGDFERRLSSPSFFRVHKSYLVNLHKVKEAFPWGNNSFALKMQCYEDFVVPVSRDKVKTLRSLLGY